MAARKPEESLLFPDNHRLNVLFVIFNTKVVFLEDCPVARASALAKASMILIHSEKTATYLHDSNVIIRAKCQKCTNNDFTKGLYCNLLLQLTSTLQT